MGRRVRDEGGMAGLSFRTPDARDEKKRRASDAFDRAVASRNGAEIDLASKFLKEIVDSDAQDGQSAFQLGVLNVMQRRYEDALRAFAQAARILPQQPVIHANLAAVALALGRAEEAISWCDRSLALKPDAAKVWNMRGNALRALRRVEEAACCFAQAATLEPGFVEALSNYGCTLNEAGRLGEALAALDRALALQPDSGPLLCNRGAVLVNLERPGEALISLDKALARGPDNVVAINNRALALKMLNRPEEALLCSTAAVAADPKQAAIWMTRAGVLADLGRVEEALASYDQGLALAPRDPAGLANKGLLLGEIGRFAEAESTLREAIALAPGRARLYYNLTQTTKLAPDDPAAERVFLHFGLAKVHEDHGAWDESFEHLSAGAGLKRGLVHYDEAATLGEMARTAQVFDQAMAARLGGRGESALAAIFIVGMPRSGSTLVEQILSSCEGVSGLGEIGAFGKAMRMNGAHHIGPFAFPELVQSLSAQDAGRIGAAYAKNVRELAPSAGRVVDKMLDNFLHLGLIAAALPKARIIHIRRNPVESCLSCYARWFETGYAFSYDLGELGRYYRAHERLMAHWRAILPEAVLITADYEAIVADLEGQSRRLAAFCGLEWDPRCLEFHNTERQVRTASKTQVRQPLFDGTSRRRGALARRLAPLLSALGADDEAGSIDRACTAALRQADATDQTKLNSARGLLGGPEPVAGT